MHTWIYIGALNKTREIRSSFLGKNVHDELHLKKDLSNQVRGKGEIYGREITGAKIQK